MTASDNAHLLLASELESSSQVDGLITLLRGGQQKISVGGLWGSSQALVLAHLAEKKALGDAPCLVVLATDGEASGFLQDLKAFGVDATPFPSREGAEGGATMARIDLAQRMAGPPEEQPRLVVSSVVALLQPLPALKDLEKELITLRCGDTIDGEGLLKHLIKHEYERQPLAEAPGEVSLRGDILDIFPFAAVEPVRIEIFEDEIESLRTFDPADQRSTMSHEDLHLCLAADSAEVGDASVMHASELFGANSLMVTIEPLRNQERAEALRVRSAAHERALRSMTKGQEQMRELSLQTLPGDDLCFETRSVQALEVGIAKAAEALREVVDSSRVIVACHGEADRHALAEALTSQGGVEGAELGLGSVSRGFRMPSWNLLIVNHHELKGVLGTKRKVSKGARHKVKAIQSFFELRPGDFVVHAVHGLARFHGLVRMKRGAGEEEHLHLMFADEVSLYVPGTRIDLVQRYIGGGSTARLDKIGTGAFKKRKERVQKGLFDLAAELLEVQAKRALHKREPWDGDEGMVADMVGSFSFTDTEDQATAYIEIAKDLSSKKPMDRMLCGDVGFGKTEIAVRAAFHVVAGGGQVAVLVPTTVLAHQHDTTFTSRLADFPVRVESLSRYTTPKETKAILAGLAAGEVDIVVGTHRILSKDVRFHRLGLVVVDEEQRFGVQHKEHFKRLRAEIDLLTLTATPIPRTLHMSLSGLRDISALATPPPGRQAIKTILGYLDDDDLVVSAIQREIGRGGQVFYLHNRVSSINEVMRRLQALIPGARYAVGHGQMGSKELRAVMDSFTRGEADVLVATTIIENGVDISAAGTILIEDADRFGLSELHQLRGRVGRGDQQARCYLLVDRHKPLRDIARQRLKALEEMSHLGAGFGISIKDLELRGAGNVLGAQQSGHIAAVGYDMYCRLMKMSVERMQAGEDADARPQVEDTEAGVELELGVAALLPPEWIPDPILRLDLLRSFTEISSPAEAQAAEQELRDRFGRPPAEALMLLRLAGLRAELEAYDVRRIALRDEVYLVEYGDPVAFEGLFAAKQAEVRRIRAGLVHVVLPKGKEGPLEALKWLEGLAGVEPVEPSPVH